MKNDILRVEILQQVSNLEKETKDLLDDLEKYTDDQLNQTVSPDVWSPMQVLNHLLISERGSLAYVRKKLSFDPVLKKAGFNARLRSILLWFFLNAPFKFNAPKGVSTPNLPVNSHLKEVAEQWRVHREDLKDFLQGVDAGRLSEEVYKHPFAGRVSLKQMISFFRQHLRRHRKQIYHRLPTVSLALYLLSNS